MYRTHSREMYSPSGDVTTNYSSEDIRDYERTHRGVDETRREVSSVSITQSDIDEDFNTPVLTERHIYVEPISIQRLEGYEAFRKILRRMELNEEMIAQAPMPPDIRDHHRNWLDWLRAISQGPYYIPLKPFLKLSGSVLQGCDNDALEWRTMRGQEAMVHKAVRIVYPKPWYSLWCTRAMFYFLLLLSFPGSFIVVLGRTAKMRAHIPYCLLWTLSGMINIGIAILMIYQTYGRFNVWFVMGTYSTGILLAAAGFGLPAYYFYLRTMERYWPAYHDYEPSAHRHMAENRAVALIFRKFYRIELPTYTSQWCYPIIYPLLGTIPGAVGALLFVSREEIDFGHIDPATLLAIVGSNLIIFVKLIQKGSRALFFTDPALERLRIHGQR